MLNYHDVHMSSVIVLIEQSVSLYSAASNTCTLLLIFSFKKFAFYHIRYMGDFYELELQSVSGARGWSIPETKGGGPSARESHTSVAYYGLGSSKLYIFGGMQGRRLNDLWQLDLGESVFLIVKLTICKNLKIIRTSLRTPMAGLW